MSQSGVYMSNSGPSGFVQTLTGNSGGAVSPTGGNINVIGSGDVTVTGNPGTSTLTISFAGAVADSFPTDSGTAIPSAGALTIAGGNNIATSGVGSTVTIDVDGTTNHAVQIGNASGSLTSLTVGTNGQVIIGATGADPAFATLTSTGGTITFTPGANSLNLEASGSVPISFPTDAGTAVPALGNLTIAGGHDIGTTGAGSTVTVNLDNAITLGDLSVIGANSNAVSATTGDINVTAGNIKMPNTNGAGTQGELVVGGLRFISNFGTFNTFIGQSSGNTTLTSVQNTAVGSGAAPILSTGLGANTVIGANSFLGLSTGTENVGVGAGAAYQLLTGSYNVAVGTNAGFVWTGSESSNIAIGNNGNSESHTIRLGTHGSGDRQQNQCFIAGINGVTASNAVMVTINSATDQLGVATIPTGIVSWTVVTAASQGMIVNSGYIANNAGTITFSLPASSAVGSILRLTGINNATGWQITQAAGQQVFFGTSSTTLGATGTLTSSATRDSVELVCVVANLTWNIVSSIGNPTIA
jgi:hypothetical protein